MNMMWKVRRLVKDLKKSTFAGEVTIAEAGKRVLIMEEDGKWLMISANELSIDEVEEEFEQNECFGWCDTVTTVKGNTVKIYNDYETDEVFFCVFARV